MYIEFVNFIVCHDYYMVPRMFLIFELHVFTLIVHNNALLELHNHEHFHIIHFIRLSFIGLKKV